MTLIFITLGVLLFYVVLCSGVSNLELIIAPASLIECSAHRCDDPINGLLRDEIWNVSHR